MSLPEAGDLHSLLIRTDFSDDKVWSSVRSTITNPRSLFRANIQFVDERRFEGLTIAALLAMVPEGSDQTFVFLADGQTMVHPEHPIQVVDLFEERGRTFRVVPESLWSVQNNLIIANVDWEDFADTVDSDGIFREFPR
jgi:hypothetical protein